MTDSNIDYKPFTVQAGKRYVREDGEIREISLDDDGGLDYPFVDEKGSNYTKDGRFFLGHNTKRLDLISEYKEPTGNPWDNCHATAEPQDEWGSWIGWNGGECPVDGDVEVSDRNGVKILSSDCVYWPNVLAYRIKKEPEVTKKSLWIDENYEWWWHKNNDDSTGAIQELIITLTNGELSIRWADVDDT